MSFWPKPSVVSEKRCGFVLDDCFEITTTTTSSIILDAIHRYKSRIFSHGSLCGVTSPIGYKQRSTKRAKILHRLKLIPEEDDETLTDKSIESYEISISKETEIIIKSPQIWGILRGLETFSQMIHFNVTWDRYVAPQAPIYIQDSPRFPHRGFLLDTSRHYLTLETIKKLLNGMETAKLNVLHWHLTDSQSFPLHIPSVTGLIEGAWTEREVYNHLDIKIIKEEAKKRGIRLYFEADAPSHARAWGIGDTELLPADWDKFCEAKFQKCPPKDSGDCNIPLDPSNNHTFEVLERVYSTLKQYNPAEDRSSSIIHTGGDEITQKCWNTPHITAWAKKMGIQRNQVFTWFLMRQYEILKKLGFTAYSWEEVFTISKLQIPKDVIIHCWLKAQQGQLAVDKGYNVLWSQGYYLDHRRGWKFYFENQIGGKYPLPKENQYLGGETCMWAEKVDDSNFEAIVWPAAAAPAERFWSSGTTATEIEEAGRRIRNFRCHLLNRGIAASSVNDPPSLGPQYPSSCYWDIGEDTRPTKLSFFLDWQQI